MINLKIDNENVAKEHYFVIYPNKFSGITIGRTSHNLSSQLSDEFQDCLEQINSICNDNAQDFTIIKMSIFANLASPSEYLEIKNLFDILIEQYFGNDKPIYVLVPEPPAGGSNLVVEIAALSYPKDSYRFDRNATNEDSAEYILKMGNDIEIYASINASADKFSNVYEQSAFFFERMQTILYENNLDFGNVVRQWMYIGNINELERFDGELVENYQMFNLARAKFYKMYDWEDGYPSATAIGASCNGCTIEFIATNKIWDKNIIPLHNPMQIDAHKYSDKYQITKSQNDENSPKFERGKIVISTKSIKIYISGTAAIIGEDSIGDDIHYQTKTTLDNITKLSSKDNLLGHGVNIQGDLPKFNIVRAYVKHIKDALIVEKMCRQHFGEIPILCVIADICRKELLVEIEAYMNFNIERMS